MEFLNVHKRVGNRDCIHWSERDLIRTHALAVVIFGRVWGFSRSFHISGKPVRYSWFLGERDELA